MDWLLVAVIAGGAYWIGNLIGWHQGAAWGQHLERVSRRIDEVTGTRRL